MAAGPRDGLRPPRPARGDGGRGGRQPRAYRPLQEALPRGGAPGGRRPARTSASCSTAGSARRRSTMPLEMQPAGLCGSAGRSSCRARCPGPLRGRRRCRLHPSRMAGRALRQMPDLLPSGRSGAAARRAGGPGAPPVRRLPQDLPRAAARDHPGQVEAPVDERTLARALERFYALGIYPDWWKLPDPGSDAAWQRIAEVIQRHDPHCRGVLLLGLDAPAAELEASFARAARQPVCKGFAIGRTIFGAPARAWLQGRDRRRHGDRPHGRELRPPDRRPGTGCARR